VKEQKRTFSAWMKKKKLSEEDSTDVNDTVVVLWSIKHGDIMASISHKCIHLLYQCKGQKERRLPK
jgi:hypothetical protein